MSTKVMIALARDSVIQSLLMRVFVNRLGLTTDMDPGWIIAIDLDRLKDQDNFMLELLTHTQDTLN